MRKTILLAATAAAALAFSGAARATVVLEVHPFTSPDPTPQIHNHDDTHPANQTGTTVFGHTQPGNVSFTFVSPTTLQSNGNGHAKIEGPWHTLTMFPTNPSFGFNAIDFNLNASGVNGAHGVPVFADIVVSLFGGGTVTFDNLSLGNGENKYLIFANAGERFTSIQWTAWADSANTVTRNLDDVRQIDVDVVAVPEPATWAMMVGGFGLLGAAMRRRRMRTVVA